MILTLAGKTGQRFDLGQQTVDVLGIYEPDNGNTHKRTNDT